jgi:hypothetical protein
MKKIIISISSVVLIAFIVVFVVSAQSGQQSAKKGPAVEKTDCSKCPSATAGCKSMETAKTDDVKKCDPAKCKEMGCDPAKCKEGKCDPATCKNAGNETKKCDMANCAMSKK